MSEETKKQIYGIVGFKISLDEIYAASKLSQNRSEEDYQSIIDQLYESPHQEEKQTAQAMKNNLNI